MEKVVSRAGIWLAIMFSALIAIAYAHDQPFAIHMGIVALAAFICLLVTIRTPDYAALTRGLVALPAA